MPAANGAKLRAVKNLLARFAGQAHDSI